MKRFKLDNASRIFFILKIFISIKIFFMTSVFSALSGENYYEGKEADRIIKSGIIQETVKEDDHKHLVIEYDNDFFWCTIEKNGNKSCVLY
tara:strand:+ start:317 stop:589 length:273 start_codon:yes stop_codon:yes gene_type:complete